MRFISTAQSKAQPINVCRIEMVGGKRFDSHIVFSKSGGDTMHSSKLGLVNL